ncbi:MAG: hypothetical protein OER56_06860 [Hyphomicrobiales bacterium]|nr:hypothetical protein [Hyphomicrobiales bacterium]
MHTLRMAFLAPAIVDLMLACLVIYRMIGVADDSLVPRGQFAGAAASWGVLLLVGLARPVERAWILPPTALIIGCIGAAFVVGFMAGTVEAGRLVFVLLICAALIWLCWAGWSHANEYAAARNSQDDGGP